MFLLVYDRPQLPTFQTFTPLFHTYRVLYHLQLLAPCTKATHFSRIRPDRTSSGRISSSSRHRRKFTRLHRDGSTFFVGKHQVYAQTASLIMWAPKPYRRQPLNYPVHETNTLGSEPCQKIRSRTTRRALTCTTTMEHINGRIYQRADFPV